MNEYTVSETTSCHFGIMRGEPARTESTPRKQLKNRKRRTGFRACCFTTGHRLACRWNTWNLSVMCEFIDPFFFFGLVSLLLATKFSETYLYFCVLTISLISILLFLFILCFHDPVLFPQEMFADSSNSVRDHRFKLLYFSLYILVYDAVIMMTL